MNEFEFTIKQIEFIEKIKELSLLISSQPFCRVRKYMKERLIKIK